MECGTDSPKFFSNTPHHSPLKPDNLCYTHGLPLPDPHSKNQVIVRMFINTHVHSPKDSPYVFWSQHQSESAEQVFH